MANPSSSSIGNATEQQWLPSVTMDSIGALGNYDKWSGGDVTATVTKYRPGGMGPEITYPSLPIIGDITVSRVFVEERDLSIVAALQTQVGLQYGTIQLQPLDAEGNANGQATSYRGRLAAVKPGVTDSTSSAPRMYDLMFAIETIGAGPNS